MRHLSYDRAVARLPDELAQKAWAFGDQSLSDDEDELFTRIAGVAPAYPEAFATKAARDAALGSYGAYVEFIPASWAQFEATGWTTDQIAIGHSLGEDGFDQVAPAVLDAVAAKMGKTSMPGSVIIGRVRYDVCRTDTGGIAVSACPEFVDTVDDHQVEKTMRWLQAEFGRRLAVTVAV